MKKHCCKFCGESDPSRFYDGSKSQCSACVLKERKEFYKHKERQLPKQKVTIKDIINHNVLIVTLFFQVAI